MSKGRPLQLAPFPKLLHHRKYTTTKNIQHKSIPVNQQNGEVQRLEVRQGRVEAAQQAPGQGHQPVTSVVDLAGSTPPARGQQLGAALGLQELQVGHLSV